jgi:uncharacterized protein
MAKVSKSDIKRDIKEYASDILNSENFKSSKNNIQHSDVSVKKHSMKVAMTSMWINRKLGSKCNEKELARGALLHDFFLYDWHAPEHCGLKNLHGFKHPAIALKNADKEFTLTDKEKNIISSHMWPLTLRHMPKCREAGVVTAADKWISTIESLRLHKLSRLKRAKARG